ncbi:hypothetical protein N7474_003301 [Penicillium riverlandense]|uniref:uncharacterized protein n=1 Tax=Penicillium riverlandense TaxID=1903569 RepID=UPI0025469BF0|nr:uncharacterized protein N7474_003301 [Penicillium riverlandense]KAJ5826163.1 hypothetical protein N7474_003301 [Penicillium riverlandense]
MSSTTHFLNPETNSLVDSQTFERESHNFLTWLKSNPGVQVSPKIALTDLRSSGAGRGVVARTNIEEGEDLFSISRATILSVQNSDLKTLLAADLDELGPWLSLMLVMIYEYLRGESSKWAPYFKVLPSRFDTLMFWSLAELQELQASPVVEKIGKQDADEAIRDKILPIVKANPSQFPPLNSLESWEGDVAAHALLELAHMMGSLIMAYAFDIEKPEDDEDDEEDGGDDGYMTDDEEQLPKGMVPLADLLNADAHRNNARLFQEEEALVMKAIMPINQGEEIFNDYGDLPRADLLRRYGYVTDNYKVFDVVELSLKEICQAAGLENADVESQPKLQLLENFDILDDGYVISRPAAESSVQDIFSTELVTLLTILTQTPSEFDAQKSKNRPPKPKLESAQVEILQRALRTKATYYPTSIAEDEQILAKLPYVAEDASSRRKRMALQVRLGEKETLSAALSVLEHHLAQVPEHRKRSASNGGETRQAKMPRV